MAATLIIPGLNGSAEGHWQRHWACDQPLASIVRQESWSRPVLDHWLAALERELERVGKAWLVTQSLGCLLAAHLARRPSAKHVLGALLVAPCDLCSTERLHPGTIAFPAMPKSPVPFPSLVVGSHDDPYMNFDDLRDYTGRWGSNLHDLGYAGHINIASGFGRWEQGYRLFSGFTHSIGESRALGIKPDRQRAFCSVTP